jgi:hypothetical protein
MEEFGFSAEYTEGFRKLEKQTTLDDLASLVSILVLNKIVSE